MGKVIGPLSWTPKERLESWYLLRELRADVKWMKSEDPKGFKGAISKEETTIKETFDEYLNAA